MKAFLRAYWPFYKHYKKKIAYAIIGMVLTSGATGAIAYMVKPLMDKIFIEQNVQMLYMLPIFIIMAFVAKGAGTYLQSYAMAYVGNDIVRTMRDRLHSHLLGLDMALMHRFHSGELVSRVRTDIDRIQAAISSDMALLMREALTAITLLGVLVYQSPRLALYTLIIIPTVAWPVDRLSRKIKSYAHLSQQKSAELIKRLNENFTNFEMIQSYNAQTYEQRRFEDYNHAFFETTLKTIKAQLALTPILELVAAIAVTLFIILGGREVLVYHTMSTGEFFSFLTALSLLIDPIRRISNLYGKFQNAIAAHERIEDLFSCRPVIQSGKKHIDHIDCITFASVSLRYGNHLALQHINFSAQKGQMVGLVGDSGGGKSSTINLLLRFYDPSEGCVLLNGEDLRHYDLSSLRGRIAIVTQRVHIAADTVAANIAYGDDQPDRERIQKALKQAHLWHEISRLPEGIDTLLHEGGTNLSGGQRQRIAIARALYKEPDILILDEATSALDNESEAIIMQTVHALKKQLIILVIAHRLSTVQKADCILVFQEGRIVCQGTQEHLERDCAAFRRLYRPKEG